MKIFASKLTIYIMMVSLLTSCNLAPKFHMPQIHVPKQFKEATAIEKPVDGKWKAAETDQPEQSSSQDWWEIFDDPQLMCLIEEANESSPTINAAKARLEQARARVKIATSNFFPDIDAGSSPSRTQSSLASQRFNPSPNVKPYTTYNAQGTIRYDLDLFGSNKSNRSFELLRMEGSESELKAVKLTLQTEIAQQFFTLRALTSEKELLEEIVDRKQSTLDIMLKKKDLGAATDFEISRYQSELSSSKAESLGIAQQLARTQHALAVLVGKTPDVFTVETLPLEENIPSIPTGLPSKLLERRPDILTAQKNMAAANQRIGIARAAFFPNITLTALGGFESAEIGELFRWSSRTWLLGPLVGTTLSMPIFKGGQGMATIALTKATFQESVEAYREKVLIAFQETEDQLSNLRLNNEQQTYVNEAVIAAEKADNIAVSKFETGDISFLDRLSTETSLLASKRQQIQTLGQRYVNTVQLIRALGGGWEDREATSEITPFPNNETPAHPQPESAPSLKDSEDSLPYTDAEKDTSPSLELPPILPELNPEMVDDDSQ